MRSDSITRAREGDRAAEPASQGTSVRRARLGEAAWGAHVAKSDSRSEDKTAGRDSAGAALDVAKGAIHLGPSRWRLAIHRRASGVWRIAMVAAAAPN